MTRRPPVGQRRRGLQVEVRLGDLRRLTAGCRPRRGRCAAARSARGWRRPAAAAPARPAGPSSLQRRLDHDGALSAEDAAVDRQQALVDRAGLDQVAGLDGGDELGQPRADDVADHADHADGTERQQRQVQHVLAAVVREVGAGQGPGHGAEVALGVLDRDDPRVLREPDERLHLDRHLRARRDVVEHHRQVGGVGDRGEVAEQAGLRRPVVVRGHDQQAVDAEPLGRPRLLDGVRGVVGARPRRRRSRGRRPRPARPRARRAARRPSSSATHPSSRGRPGRRAPAGRPGARPAPARRRGRSSRPRPAGSPSP